MKKSICLIILLFLFTSVYSADLKFDGSNKIKTGSLVKGLVGHWSLSEQSIKATSPDTILADLSAYGNDGTNHGAIFTTNRMGITNRAMSFDGENDYVNCGNDESLDITDAVTISAWVKPNVVSDYKEIVRKENAGDKKMLFSIQNGNIFSFGTHNGTSYSELDYSGFDSSYIGKWTHLVATHNSSGVRNIYINGISVDNDNVGTGITAVGTANLFIGSAQGTSEYFNGTIDEVRIYNRALSPAEILFLYESYRPYFIMSGE